MTDVEAPGLSGTQQLEVLQQALKSRMQRRAAQAGRYGQDFAGLWDQMGSHVEGGKLLRPRLFLEAAEALTRAQPDDPDELIEIGVGIEMLHYAFLLHDDVIDRDFRRRQGPNLLGEVREAHPAPHSEAASRWGSAAGILAGDLMISEVHQIFARARVGEQARLPLLDLLDYTIQKSVCGEQADVGLGLGTIEPTLATALAMTQYKTATYSFELPLRAAAIIAGAGEGIESALAVAARHLGTAYQLQDDLLSAFGAAHQHGKEPWSDFREGKQTPLIAYARTTEAWPQIADYLGRAALSSADTVQVRTLLRECGAEQFIAHLLNEQLEAMARLLGEDSPLPEQARRILLTYTDTMKGRTR